MKMWSMSVIILLLFFFFFFFCNARLSTGSERVYFISRNFSNVFHWDPVQPSFPGEQVHYSVWYWSDAVENQTFQIKKECQNISTLSCDLTAETPSVHDVHYRAKVYFKGNSRRSKRFKPIADTVLGPPILFTYTTVSSLHVNVNLPLGPNGVSIADIITNSKNGPIKIDTVYTLKITHPAWAAQVSETGNGRFVINLRNNKTEYCGYVVYKPLTEWGRSASENASFCATLPDNPLTLLPWLLASAALLTAVIIVSVVCMCYYVKGGKEKNMPQLLVTTFSYHPRVLQSPDRNLIISKLDVSVQSDQTVYSTIRVKPNMPAVVPGGYSPQDIPWQGNADSSAGTGASSPTSNPENTSAQSSESYAVVAVHVPAEQNEDFQQATIDNKETSDRAPCESNPARPLLLQTVRDPNGQLVLPSFIFQLQSSTDDTVSPLSSERKPLLSDLIDSNAEGPSLASLQSFDSSEWSDSGCDDSTVNTPTQPYCNTNYSPSQPVAPYFQQGCENTPLSDAIFESGYKQNCLPAIILGTASKDSKCEYRKTNYPWTWTGPKKEEGDEDREERSRQMLLGVRVMQVEE